jgi:hypothetical protein
MTEKQNTEEELHRLRAHISYLRGMDARRKNVNLVVRIFLSISAIAVFAAVIFLRPPFKNLRDLAIYYPPRLLLTFVIVLIAVIITRKTWNVEPEIRSLENEIDLLNIDVASLEARSEKLYRNHQYELEKYYDQTLRHSSYIFTTGIVCIGLGFILVGLTFGLLYSTDGTDEKIITGVVGSIGTITTNFIGAIYIKMYSETLNALTNFHNRLVLTHHLIFSNFLSSKIQDKKLREATISTVVNTLVRQNGAMPTRETSKRAPPRRRR